MTATIRGRVAYLAGRVRGPEHRFRAIYDHNLWGADETRSGRGSRRGSAEVGAAIAALETAHRLCGFASIADVPCGEADWIFDFLDGRRIDYVGYDIVEAIVVSNRERRPSRAFRTLDIIRQVPERADLIFCRDLLNHLTRREIVEALRNMVASGARWFLASNNFGWAYADLPFLSVRTSRHVDLTAAPFSLPAPMWRDDEHALWEMAALAPFIERLDTL